MQKKNFMKSNIREKNSQQTRNRKRRNLIKYIKDKPTVENYIILRWRKVE